MRRSGWFKESYRHYLAGKGIKTKRYHATTQQKLAPRLGAIPTTEVNIKKIFGTPSGAIVDSQQKIFDLQDQRKFAKAKMADVQVERLRSQAKLAREAERVDAPDEYVKAQTDAIMGDLALRRRGIDRIEQLEGYQDDILNLLVDRESKVEQRKLLLKSERALHPETTDYDLDEADAEIAKIKKIREKIMLPGFEFKTSNDLAKTNTLLTGAESTYVRGVAAMWLTNPGGE